MSICKLCHGPGPLRNSHVMPELMYGPLYEPDDHRFRHVDVETGETRIMQKGLREKLFCATCESPRLSDLERRYSQDLEIPDEVTDSQLTLNADYGQVKLCLLSILWRAGISGLDAFSEVTLGSRHETRMREMVLAENPGQEREYGILGHIVLKPGSQSQIGRRMIGFPATRRHPRTRYRMYGFIAAGVMWSIYVTAPGDGRTADISLHEDGTLVLHKAPTPHDMPMAAALAL